MYRWVVIGKLFCAVLVLLLVASTSPSSLPRLLLLLLRVRFLQFLKNRPALIRGCIVVAAHVNCYRVFVLYFFILIPHQPYLMHGGGDRFAERRRPRCAPGQSRPLRSSASSACCRAAHPQIYQSKATSHRANSPRGRTLLMGWDAMYCTVVDGDSDENRERAIGSWLLKSVRRRAPNPKTKIARVPSSFACSFRSPFRRYLYTTMA